MFAAARRSKWRVSKITMTIASTVAQAVKSSDSLRSRSIDTKRVNQANQDPRSPVLDEGTRQLALLCSVIVTQRF